MDHELMTMWLSVDPLANKYPSLSPYAYCAWNPVNLVDSAGLSSDFPPFRKIASTIYGIVNNLNRQIESAKHPTILKNTFDATAHYYFGQGKPIPLDEDLGDKLVETDEFKGRHNRIVNGKTTALSGNFGVDMTYVDPVNTFFIGDTRVDYCITISEDNSICTVTYKLFVQDGFYDPNFIAEEFGNVARGLMNLGITALNADREGKNLELGGTPYKFVPQVRVFKFNNPGYTDGQ